MTPNEYFYLFVNVQGKDTPKGINNDLSLKSLVKKGWLEIDGTPSIRLKESNLFLDIPLTDASFSSNIEKFRLMFPPILLPSGKYARSTPGEIESKFKWFFKNYNYEWTTIFKATEQYINYFQPRGYAYMKTSSFFIYKQDLNKIKTSTLGEWCEKVSCNEEEKSFDIDL